LLVILNGLAAWIWSPELKFFPSPFPTSTWVIGGVHISKQDTGTFGVTLACVFVLWLFFRFTKLGLANARGRGQPPSPRAARRSHLVAARARLGLRGGARRGQRNDERADELPLASMMHPS